MEGLGVICIEQRGVNDIQHVAKAQVQSVTYLERNVALRTAVAASERVGGHHIERFSSAAPPVSVRLQCVADRDLNSRISLLN